MRARRKGAGHQWKLGVERVDVLDDRGRLGEEGPVVELQHRYEAEGVARSSAAPVLGRRQHERDVLCQALLGQRDAHLLRVNTGDSISLVLSITWRCPDTKFAALDTTSLLPLF